jgi:hypothetical protein
VTQPADAWLDLGPAEFELDGVHYYFVAHLIGEHGSNRNPKRTRPFRIGSKLDHTGCNGDEFTIDCTFGRDVTEEDVFNEWPNDLERMILAFKTGKTGTLNLPWKRGLRVKADEWDRTASASENRGHETLRVKFSEDNEDNLDRAAVELVSVKATVQNAVQAAQFDAESEGMDIGAIEDVTELAANVVGLLNAPGDAAAALLHAGNRLRLAAKTVTDAFSSGAPGRDQMNGPEGASARLRLLQLSELGARAVGEGRSRQRKTRTVTYQRVRDIWTIATDERQNARELMTINEEIEDFSNIPAGTPVRMYVV